MAKLIVALDPAAGAPSDTIRLAMRLAPYCDAVKLGPVFTSRYSCDWATTLGLPVMFDPKLHDIPDTVTEAVRGLNAFNPLAITVHAAGGTRMIRAACNAASESKDTVKPVILAVTVLSSDRLEGLDRFLRVEELTCMALEAGADGVVCPPACAGWVRAHVKGRPFLVVTAGIRPAGSPDNDHAGTFTPTEAIHAGADWLVVGRPITGASDPVAAARMVRDEMDAAIA